MADQPKQDQNKSEPHSFVQMTKEDGVDLIYRMGASNITKVAQTTLVMLLKQQGVKKRYITAMTEFCNTKIGGALVSYGMGMVLTYMPSIKDNPRARRMAKEFRVGGMTIGGNELVSGMVQGAAHHLLPFVMQTLNALPEPDASIDSPALMEALAKLPITEEKKEEKAAVP